MQDLRRKALGADLLDQIVIICEACGQREPIKIDAEGALTINTNCQACGYSRQNGLLVGSKAKPRREGNIRSDGLPTRIDAQAARRGKIGRPRIEDRGDTIEAQKPWIAAGMSRRTWYARQKEKRAAPPLPQKQT